MSDYKLGAMAAVTARGRSDMRAMRVRVGSGHYWVDSHDRLLTDQEVTDVRPLVVLDLDEPQALVADLNSAAYCVRPHGRMGRIDMLAQTIEAQTKPPKPAEPTGLGAVVEDADGATYTRLDGDFAPWYKTGVHYADRPWRYYTDLNVVRVLSEGVTQ